MQLLEKEKGFEVSKEVFNNFEDKYIAEKAMQEKIKNDKKIILPIKPKACKQCEEFNNLLDEKDKEIKNLTLVNELTKWHIVNINETESREIKRLQLKLDLIKSFFVGMVQSGTIGSKNLGMKAIMAIIEGE